MQKYELVLILSPKLDSKEEKKLLSKTEELITSLKGKLSKKESWGKKPLSYPINHHKEGLYHFFKLEFLPESLKEWREKMRLEENIIRYLLIKQEE